MEEQQAQPAILSSWKEIACFFGKGVRTVQRWERTLGLPVYRPEDAAQHIIFARADDLQKWLEGPKSKRREDDLISDPPQNRERMRILVEALAVHTARLRENTKISHQTYAAFMEQRERVRARQSASAKRHELN